MHESTDAKRQAETSENAPPSQSLTRREMLAGGAMLAGVQRWQQD
jgi:hypothetical protein